MIDAGGLYELALIKPMSTELWAIHVSRLSILFSTFSPAAMGRLLPDTIGRNRPEAAGRDRQRTAKSEQSAQWRQSDDVNGATHGPKMLAVLPKGTIILCC
jgi:hypothetical protein